MLINCDLGEEIIPNPDEEVMPLIDMANIACGGHAGNKTTIQNCIQSALENNVLIGAHPSYPDKENFGRQSLNISPQEIIDTVKAQLDFFLGLLMDDQKLHHIKPHGALYLDMMKEEAIYRALLKFMNTHFPATKLVVQGGCDSGQLDKHYQTIANEYHIELMFEGFADRGYERNGHLMSRKQPNALYLDSKLVVDQYEHFNQVNKFQTLCFHSDNHASVIALKQIHSKHLVR